MFTFKSKFFHDHKCFTFFYHMNMLRGGITVSVGKSKTLFSQTNVQWNEWRRVQLQMVHGQVRLLQSCLLTVSAVDFVL